MTYTTRRITLTTLTALTLGTFTLAPSFAQGPADDQPDPVQKMHDFIHDPSQSTGTGDIFAPWTTPGVHQVDPSEDPEPAPSPAPAPPADDPAPSDPGDSGD